MTTALPFRGALAIVALSLVAAARPVTIAPHPLAKGMTGTITMSVDPPVLGAQRQGSTQLTGTISMVDGKARVDIARSTGPALSYETGDFMLLLDQRRVKYIRPGAQTFWDQDSPFDNPLVALAQNAGSIAVSDISVKLDTVGAGDMVAGAASTKYRLTISYSIAMGAQAIPSSIVTDLTVAKLPVKFYNAAVGTLQGLSLIGSADVNTRVGAVMSALAAEGVIVHSVSTTTISAAGFNISTTQKMDITDLKEGDVDDSKLAMPAGFKQGF